MLTTRESFSLNADIRDAANNQKVMLHATYSTTSLSLNIDVLDAGYVAENDESVPGGRESIPAGSLQAGLPRRASVQDGGGQ